VYLCGRQPAAVVERDMCWICSAGHSSTWICSAGHFSTCLPHVLHHMPRCLCPLLLSGGCPLCNSSGGGCLRLVLTSTSCCTSMCCCCCSQGGDAERVNGQRASLLQAQHVPLLRVRGCTIPMTILVADVNLSCEYVWVHQLCRLRVDAGR
jgi:hypothetical protein